MTIGTLVKHSLKALNGSMQMIWIVALLVQTVCLVCCISDAMDLTTRTRELDIISDNSKVTRSIMYLDAATCSAANSLWCIYLLCFHQK